MALRVVLSGYNESVLEDYPYMRRSFGATRWLWVSGSLGMKLLGLPLDADVLSLYTLSPPTLTLTAASHPHNCVSALSPECRLHVVRRLIIENVTLSAAKGWSGPPRAPRPHLLCHRVVSLEARLTYRCCDVAQFVGGDHSCEVYPGAGDPLAAVVTLTHIIAALLTLSSPALMLRLKLLITFHTFTKFFRASLKHGITGQRSYVIRISSRQLVRLADGKPFSLPRAIFRLLVHCYGEGRCCIHCWHRWRHQPAGCRRDACCRRAWLQCCRLVGVVLVYPAVFYVAVGLYAPRLALYTSVVAFTQHVGVAVRLPITVLGAALVPSYAGAASAWLLFSLVAFVYTALLLSWPHNSLERCLLAAPPPQGADRALYLRLSLAYKAVLTRLVYGEGADSQRHLLGVPLAPWGVRRVALFLVRLFVQIPVIGACASLLSFDSRLFRMCHPPPPGVARGDDPQEESCGEVEEGGEGVRWPAPTAPGVCKGVATAVIWLGFVLVLAGYCSAVFVMTQFLLNVVVFTLVGCVLRSTTLLPWLLFTAILVLHVNDSLWRVNEQHSTILRLIDEHSPRLCATEDGDDRAFDAPQGGGQLLRAHNLGAVKFIDGDNVEYVSKELFYSVCADLHCGWSASVRRVIGRLAVLVLFSLFVFLCLSAVGSLTGAGVVTSLAAGLISLLPKLWGVWRSRSDGGAAARKRCHWARVMPDLLDRHVRVERGGEEGELGTYDVRAVGQLELLLPRSLSTRGLRVWKFPWAVSTDQQTHAEPFVVALANKLAAAVFLSRVVTRAYAPVLQEPAVLRQWCLLVETCIVEGSDTAASLNGVALDSLRLFGRDVQRLVSSFCTGATIDSVVDAVNRELYGPYTKGVLITVGNTAIAICKLNSLIFAFNSAGHADQLSDLFGAVLIATDFNIQNLQTTIKYIINPYSPDSVPVYATLPTEGFVFRSPDILEEQASAP